MRRLFMGFPIMLVNLVVVTLASPTLASDLGNTLESFDFKNQGDLVLLILTGLGVVLAALMFLGTLQASRAKRRSLEAEAQLGEKTQALLKLQGDLQQMRDERVSILGEINLLKDKYQATSKALEEATTKNRDLVAKLRDKETQNESALVFLTLLQERGRFVDFLMEDVSGYSDQEVGVASRVVHGGCRKLLQECFNINPILSQPEGDKVLVDSLAKVEHGDDSSHFYRFVGKVPETLDAHREGRLVHRGWLTTKINLPKRAATNPLETATQRGVIVPAEIEL